MARPSTGAGARALDFLRVNQRPGKPRTRGMTEIRGPYYTPMGRRYLQDILETRSCSSNACARGSGARRASGAGS
jgi:phosphosulfolactate synthase (CoM biosynthesis protein A)